MSAEQRADAVRGGEHGYTYTGDTGNAYLVTMLNRDTKQGTARVLVERPLSGEPTLPNGVTITVPLRKVTVNGP